MSATIRAAEVTVKIRTTISALLLAIDLIANLVTTSEKALPSDAKVKLIDVYDAALEVFEASLSDAMLRVKEIRKRLKREKAAVETAA